MAEAVATVVEMLFVEGLRKHGDAVCDDAILCKKRLAAGGWGGDVDDVVVYETDNNVPNIYLAKHARMRNDANQTPPRACASLLAIREGHVADAER